MTISTDNVRDYLGKNLYDEGGNKIGKIGMIFLDDASGQPEWVTVSTGFFGTNESFVPLAQANPHEDGGLQVPYSKDTVKGAPNVDVDQGHLSPDEESQLYSYYGVGDSGSGQGQYVSQSEGTAAGTSTTNFSDRPEDTTGYAATDTRRDDSEYSNERSGQVGDDAMTRSEERLNVGKETVTTGKARLRKYVETEHQSVDVPIRREKVRLETEPVTDANRDAAFSGPDISEEEHEVTLTEERPVVSTEAVPVERVRLTKETEEETRTVDADVRKERVDLDADEDVDQRRP